VYRAFISYSHADLALAKRLHRALESYHLPKRLVGMETPRGVVPAGLGPIFRDVDELPASDDLNNEIKGALAASGALIILCSPQAKASRWVNREIELFREIHGTSRPILAALIDGEPEDAFPLQLVAGGGEPVAADFRKGGDGHQLARLKLVAGLTGIGLNTLVQRDAQAQVRRVTVITGIAIAALLIMALLLAAALRARTEADRQRAEAEGLVEYMLTDLRTRLKGVGRLDVMADVNARAMNYYDDEASLEGLPPESLARRARVLHAMGEDDEKLGQIDKALSKFREAHRTTAAVVGQLPDNGDAIFAHAQSEYWVGYAAQQLEQRETTEKHWRGYLMQAERLARVEPGSVRSLMEQGYAHGNMCAFFQSDDVSRNKAMAHCNQSVAFEQQALAKEPDNREIMGALANRLGWIAVVALREDRAQESLDYRTQEFALLERAIAKDPDNADFSERLVWSELGTASALSALGRNREAIATSRLSLSRIDSLIRRNGATSGLLELKLKARVVLLSFRKSGGDPAWTSEITPARAALADFTRMEGGGKTSVRYEQSINKLATGGSE
jgi:tetratricopeptide (TPR) repeat protein